MTNVEYSCSPCNECAKITKDSVIEAEFSEIFNLSLKLWTVCSSSEQ